MFTYIIIFFHSPQKCEVGAVFLRRMRGSLQSDNFLPLLIWTNLKVGCVRWYSFWLSPHLFYRRVVFGVDLRKKVRPTTPFFRIGFYEPWNFLPLGTFITRRLPKNMTYRIISLMLIFFPLSTLMFKVLVFHMDVFAYFDIQLRFYQYCISMNTYIL